MLSVIFYLVFLMPIQCPRQYRLIRNFSWRISFPQVDAGINRLGILCSHLSEQIFDDHRGVMFIVRRKTCIIRHPS